MDAHTIWTALTTPAPVEMPQTCRQEVLDKISHIQDLFNNVKRYIEPDNHVYYPDDHEIIISYINDIQNKTQAINAITAQNRTV